MKNCGHCSNCIQGKLKRPRAIPRSPVQPISVDQVEQIQLLMREGQAALRASRQVARFLCGITSPATTRDRLTRHDAFGLLKEQPFNEVLEQCESLMA
jgi:ATP-dependent DNA helicase RecQ